MVINIWKHLVPNLFSPVSIEFLFSFVNIHAMVFLCVPNILYAYISASKFLMSFVARVIDQKIDRCRCNDDKIFIEINGQYFLKWYSNWDWMSYVTPLRHKNYTKSSIFGTLIISNNIYFLSLCTNMICLLRL